jgi:hypothetical protein
VEGQEDRMVEIAGVADRGPRRGQHRAKCYDRAILVTVWPVEICIAARIFADFGVGGKVDEGK